MQDCVVNRTGITLENKIKSNLVRGRGTWEDEANYNVGILRVALKYLKFLININVEIAKKYAIDFSSIKSLIEKVRGEYLNSFEKEIIRINAPVEIVPVQEEVIANKLGKMDGAGFTDMLKWFAVSHVGFFGTVVRIPKTGIDISSLQAELNHLSQVSSLFQMHRLFPFDAGEMPITSLEKMAKERGCWGNFAKEFLEELDGIKAKQIKKIPEKPKQKLAVISSVSSTLKNPRIDR